MRNLLVLRDHRWGVQSLVYQYGKVEFADGKPHLNFQRTCQTCT